MSEVLLKRTTLMYNPIDFQRTVDLSFYVSYPQWNFNSQIKICASKNMGYLLGFTDIRRIF